MSFSCTKHLFAGHGDVVLCLFGALSSLLKTTLSCENLQFQVCHAQCRRDAVRSGSAAMHLRFDIVCRRVLVCVAFAFNQLMCECIALPLSQMCGAKAGMMSFPNYPCGQSR